MAPTILNLDVYQWFPTAGRDSNQGRERVSKI
jgi:hypothetical protein